MMVNHRKIALRKLEPPANFYARWPSHSMSPHGSPPYTSRYSALHLAVREGHLDLIKVLLQSDHPIDAASSHFCCVPWRSGNRQHLPWHDWFQYHLTPLHTALCFGQSEIAQFLITSGASIRGEESAYQAPILPGGLVRTGATALHLACACGDLPTAEFIVKEGYINDIDVQDVRGYSPLWYAFIHGKWDCLEWLLGRGANINLCVPRLPNGAPLAPGRPLHVDYYASLLDYAIACSRFDDATRLMQAGIDAQTTVSRIRTPLHSCCALPGSPPNRLPLIEQLLESNLDINSRILSGYTPLLSAVSVRDILATQILIQRGAILDLQLDDGTPAVWLACSLRPHKKTSSKKRRWYLRGASPETVRLLLEGGARIDEPRREGQTLLQCVCRSYPTLEKVAIVRLLVQHTKDFDSNIELIRDLVYSCFVTGDGRSLKVMLERMVAPRLWTSKDDLLHLFQLTMGRPNLTCLEYLLNIDTENHILWEPTNILNLLAPGTPPVTVCEEMVLLLLRSGSHQDFRSQPCTIMLHLASSHGFTEVVRWFLDRGVSVGHRDAANNSALAYATSEGTINLLLERGADPWESFEHSEKNIEDTPIGMAIMINNSWKLEKLLMGSTGAPPCAIYDMIEYAIISGAADCVKTLQEIYPAQTGFLLSKNAARYLLKMLVRFSRQTNPPQFDELFKDNLADSVVETMHILLESDPLIDLEVGMQARIPLVDTSIIHVVQDILAENRVQEPDARLRSFRDFRRRVSIYWTTAEPEIIITAPSSSSSSSSAASSSTRSIVLGPGAIRIPPGPPPAPPAVNLLNYLRTYPPTAIYPPSDSGYDTTSSEEAGLDTDTDASAHSDASSSAGSAGLADD